MSPRRLCAVVPAAGRGTRAGIATPKILAPLAPGVTVWSLLRDRLLGYVDRVVVVLSPEGAELFARDHLPHEPAGRVSIAIQPAPRGMGDAVFAAEAHWPGFDDVLVVWGDQAGVSAETLGRAAEAQRRRGPRAITLPLVEAERPYVQYDFDAAGVLRRVRQSREGDRCDARGLADVGCFALATDGLGEAWRAFARAPERALGRVTGELNFLPFLAFLAADEGWTVHPLAVHDPDERRGINTPEELAFFRDRLDRPAR